MRINTILTEKYSKSYEFVYTSLIIRIDDDNVTLVGRFVERCCPNSDWAALQTTNFNTKISGVQFGKLRLWKILKKLKLNKVSEV